MPTHAVQAPNGDIFVSDGYGQNRIHRFSAKGEHILSFGGGDSVFLARRFGTGPADGTPGTEPGQFNVPHDVFVSADSQVYVMDRENNRWQVFNVDGELQSICEGVNHPNKLLPNADGTYHLVGAAGVRSGSRTARSSVAGARRAMDPASSCGAASTAAGSTRTARSTRPSQASSTGFRNLQGSDSNPARRWRSPGDGSVILSERRPFATLRIHSAKDLREEPHQILRTASRLSGRQAS